MTVVRMERTKKKNELFSFLNSKVSLLKKINSNTRVVYQEDNARLLFFVVTSIILDNYHPQEWGLLDNEE